MPMGPSCSHHGARAGPRWRQPGVGPASGQGRTVVTETLGKKDDPIRVGTQQHRRMADEILTRVLEAMRAKPRKGKGEVYRWLWVHYDELLRAFAETDAGWAAVSSVMRQAGVVGARGNPPTRKSLAKVWVRVRRDNEAVDGRLGPGEKRMPSRLPPSLGPSVSPTSRAGADATPGTPPAEMARRKMRVLRSLDHARAATEPSLTGETGPAPSAEGGVLPPARWPKPFN